MIFTIIIATLLISVVLIWKIPIWQLAKRKKGLEVDKYLNLENEYRKTIAQIIGGIYVLGGFAFTWFQFLATQDSILLTQERLITDRYSKAVDQLGGASSSTRLGGIYALGSIGKTSVEYAPVVNNVLVAYIRQNYSQSSSLKEELQASIDILAQKQFKSDLKKEYNQEFNLSNITLDSFDFSAAFLKKANISGSSLKYTALNKAQFSKVQAIGTILTGANLTESIIDDSSSFYGADLTRAHLNNAFIKNCNFKLANFNEAQMSNIDLSGTDLTEAELKGAILYGANLQTTKGLTKEQISEALLDAHTKLPYYLK